MGLVEKFLSSTSFWGVIALIAWATSMSGKLSVTAASVISWTAWVLAVFLTVRALSNFKMNKLVKLLILLPCASLLAVFVIWGNRWMSTKEDAKMATNVPPTMKIPGQPLQDLLPTKSSKPTRLGVQPKQAIAKSKPEVQIKEEQLVTRVDGNTVANSAPVTGQQFNNFASNQGFQGTSLEHHALLQ